MTVNQFLNFPTGGGKTHKAAAVAEQQRGKTVVLAPTVALIEEIAADWQARLPGKVVQAYSHKSPSKKPYRVADIIVMSGERLDLITRHWRKQWHWLAQVTLLVADEFHTVSDPVRGPALEAGLIRLSILNPLMQRLVLTATAGNPEEICAWLGDAKHVYHAQRPIPLEWTVKVTTSKEQALKSVLKSRPSPALIFVHSRARAMTLAAKAQEAGRRAAYHHAGLSSAQRHEVETQYRTGEIDELYCTPTLAAGVNLPAAHVVLLDLSFGRGERLSHNEVWQRAGRAGRPGLRDQGFVTLIGSLKENPAQYLESHFEPLHTAIKGPALEGFILGSIDGGFAVTPPQLTRLMGRRLGGREEDTAAALRDLAYYGATEEVRGKLQLTRLGRVASRNLLRASDVAFFRHLPEDPTAFDVILTAAGRRPALRLPEEARDITEAGLQQTPSRTLDSREWLEGDILASAYAAYAACLAGDEEAAESLGIWPTDLRLYREDLARLVQAWAELTVNPKQRLVSVMLHQGLPLEAATLTMLNGIGPKTALKWHRAGIEDVEDLACTEAGDERLAGFSLERQRKLIQQAEQLVKTFDSDVTREPAPSIKRSELELDIQGHFDPVRLSRALGLNVTPKEGRYLVTGGHAPHLVSSDLTCDCPDYRAGRPCKHVLAVRLHRGDPQTVRNAELISEP